MRLFQYAVYFVGPEVKDLSGNVLPRITNIIVDVTSIIAKDEETVRVIASRRIPEDYLDKISDIKIAVRPF